MIALIKKKERIFQKAVPTNPGTALQGGMNVRSNRILKRCNHLEELIVAIALILMTAITFVNVISRYFLHASLAFTEELTTNMFVVLTLFGSAIGVRRGAHLGLSILTDALSKKAQRAVAFIGNGLSAILYLVIVKHSINMIKTQFTSQQISPALGIPQWLLSLTIPIGCLLLALHFVLLMMAQIRGDS